MDHTYTLLAHTAHMPKISLTHTHTYVGGRGVWLHTQFRVWVSKGVWRVHFDLLKKSSVKNKGDVVPAGTCIFYLICIEVCTSKVMDALFKIFKCGLLQAPSLLLSKVGGCGERVSFFPLSPFFPPLVSSTVLLPAGLTVCHSIGHPSLISQEDIMLTSSSWSEHDSGRVEEDVSPQKKSCSVHSVEENCCRGTSACVSRRQEQTNWLF